MADKKKNPSTRRDEQTMVKERVKRPRRHKVLLHNDDFTPMEFVVEILESVFNRSAAEATRIMLTVHRSGLGVAGVFSAEIAEAKTMKTLRFARESDTPPLHHGARMNLADELRVALSRALDEATKHRHEFLTLEHVLLALLHDPSTADVLKAVGCDLATLERDLAAYLESEVEKFPEGRPVEPQQTPAFQRSSSGRPFMCSTPGATPSMVLPCSSRSFAKRTATVSS